jgi:predicted nucleic acid-binding protein
VTRAAVLDACVLLPITLTDALLRSAERGFYLPKWSGRILDEVKRNIIVKRGVSEKDASARIRSMEHAFPEAMVAGYESLEQLMTNDPKDRHFLAAAVKVGAPIVVTQNLRDFPPEACDPFDVEIMTPSHLLDEFLAEAPEDIIDMLHEQADDMQFPRFTFDELLEAFERHTPDFR